MDGKAHIEILEAGPEDLARIRNMARYYNYDLSEWYPVPFGEDGQISIRPRDEYWARPDTRPFLVRVDGSLAGYAVVDGDLLDAKSQFNMGWFFIARRYRGAGVGRQVASSLFRRFPGRWEMYYLERNLPASRFWDSVLRRLGVVDLSSERVEVDGQSCTVFRFSTADAGGMPA